MSGLLVAAWALLLLVVGRLGAEMYLTRISLPLFLSGAVVFLLGWRQLRVLLLPLVLLLVAIPLPAVIVTEVSVPLQFIASAAAERMLNAAAVPVLRDGNVLVLPNATLQVAEACSGIRSLATLVALSILMARGMTTAMWSRVLVVVASIPAAVAVNALRVAITAAGTYWYGPIARQGATHEAVGFLMFMIAFAIVGAWGHLLRSFDFARARARATT
jgi:exosortase